MKQRCLTFLLPELRAIFADPRWSGSVADGDAGGGLDALNDEGQVVRAQQAAPIPRGGVDQGEDHELSRLLRKEALGPHRSMADQGEDALDRVRGPQVECSDGIARP